MTAVLAVRRLPTLLLAPLLAGCLPYYHPDPGLERERDELRVQERGHPDAARYPQARYAVCEKLAGSGNVWVGAAFLVVTCLGFFLSMGSLCRLVINYRRTAPFISASAPGVQ